MHPLPQKNHFVLMGDDDEGKGENMICPIVNKHKGCKTEGDSHNHPHKTGAKRDDRQSCSQLNAKMLRMTMNLNTMDKQVTDEGSPKTFDKECQPTSSSIKWRTW